MAITRRCGYGPNNIHKPHNHRIHFPSKIPSYRTKKIPTISEIKTATTPIEIETLDPISILLVNLYHIYQFLDKSPSFNKVFSADMIEEYPSKNQDQSL
jgi:hypothetical protein